MLTGLALNQYFNGELGNFLFEDTCKYFYGFFEGPSSERKNFGEWNAILLKIIMDKNIDKLTSNYLQILIDIFF